MIVRNCDYCGKEFTVQRASSTKKTCDNTCRTYKSQVNTGKRPSLTAVNSLAKINPPSTIQKKAIQQVEHKLAIAQKELNELESELRGLNTKVRSGVGTLEKERDKIQEQINHNDSLLDFPNVTDERFEEINQGIEKDTATLKELDQQIVLKAARIKELEKIIPSKIVAVFRLTEQRNKHVIATLPKSNIITGNLAKIKNQYRTFYPFSKIKPPAFKDNSAIYALDCPIKPFVVSIFGKEGVGKTSCAIAICKDLIKYFNPPILYMVDINQMSPELEDMISNKLNVDNFHLLQNPSKHEITNALNSYDFEFLFIDQSNAYQMDSKYLYELQKQFPNLSVFCISNGTNVSIKKKANLVIEVRYGAGLVIKGCDRLSYIRGWENCSSSQFRDYPTK